MPGPVMQRVQLGYNAQLHSLPSGRQMLGNGLRVYSPALMRFHSADRLSPFGQGGFNSYAYCHLDPINRKDPSGQSAVWLASGLAVGILGVFTIGAVAAYHTDKHKLASVLAIVGAGLAVATTVGGFAVGLAKTTPRTHSTAMSQMGRSHPVATRTHLAERSRPVDARRWASTANQPLTREPRFEPRHTLFDAQRAPIAAASPARARSQPQPPQKPRLQLSLNMNPARPAARLPGSILRAEGEVAAANKRVRFNDDLDMLWFDRDDNDSVWSSDT